MKLNATPLSGITWHRNKLQLVAEKLNKTWPFQGLSEEDMMLIQHWCEETKCGTRTSFDTIKFNTIQEVNLFLLRWA
jgi:hypothetical protein